MTETVAQPEAASAPEPAPEATPPSLPSARSTWLWRLGSVALLALGVWVFVVASDRAETALPTETGDPVVRQISPTDGSKALRQTQIGADLLDGYDGRLTINGVQIPEEQMEGVLDPTSPEAKTLPPEVRDQIRPNNRNRVYFQPSPGKVIEKLPQGRTEITVTYFQDGAPTLKRGSISWTIDVD